jgi:hypothetical protein
MTDLPQLQQLLVEAADRRIRRPRHALRLTLVFAVLGLAVLVVTNLPQDAADREVPATPPATATPTPTAVSKNAVERAFGVFRRPARSQDDPGQLPRAWRGTTRRIASTGEADVFLILAGNNLCMWTRSGRRGGGGGCGPRGSYLAGHRVIGSFSDDDGPSMIALAFPDGVHEVTLTLANGTRATYPVKDNGFARAVPARLARLDWIAPDGKAMSQQLSRAPAFRADDVYPALKRAPTPHDALDGLPGARLVAQSGDARAWLVPRLGAVCLVLNANGAQASGCRRKVADVRYPVIVALHSAIAIAFPRGATRVSVDGRPRASDAFLLTDGAPHTLRYRDPARQPRTDRLPAPSRFALHARLEPPTAIPRP